jgi:hypothetical protein
MGELAQLRGPMLAAPCLGLYFASVHERVRQDMVSSQIIEAGLAIV